MEDVSNNLIGKDANNYINNVTTVYLSAIKKLNLKLALNMLKQYDFLDVNALYKAAVETKNAEISAELFKTYISTLSKEHLLMLIKTIHENYQPGLFYLINRVFYSSAFQDDNDLDYYMGRLALKERNLRQLKKSSNKADL